MKKTIFAVFIQCILIYSNIQAQIDSSILTIQTGHNSTITAFALSSDERFVYTGSNDFLIKEWDLELGLEIRTFKGHTDGVQSITLNSDGSKMISTSIDGTIKLWDLKTAKCLRTFIGHKNNVKSACFSLNEDLILSASWDNTIRIWDVNNGNTIKIIDNSARVQHVSISPDGQYFVTSSSDNTAKIWSFSDYHLIKNFRLTDEVNYAQFTSDCKYLVVADGYYERFSTLTIFNTQNWQKERSFIVGQKTGVYRFAISHNSKYIITGLANKPYEVILWDFETGKEIKRYCNHLKETRSYCFTKNDAAFLSSGFDKHILVTDIASGKVLKRIYPSVYGIGCSQLSKNEQYVAYASANNAQLPNDLFVWDIFQLKLEHTFHNQPDRVFDIRFTPDNKYLVTNNGDKTIRIFDLKKKEKIFTLTSGGDYFGSIEISNDGKTIMAPVPTGIRFYDIETGKNITMTYFTDGGKLDLAIYTPDNAYVIGGKNKTFYIMDRKTGTTIAKKTTPDFIRCMNISNDGRFLITTCSNKKIYAWDLMNLENTPIEFEGETGVITSIGFSQDNQMCIGSSFDFFTRIWEIKTGKKQGEYNDHQREVKYAAFCKDGKSILSTGYDGSLRIRNIKDSSWIAFIAENKSSLTEDSNNWLVLDDEGYWDASSNGGKLVAMVNGREAWRIDQFAVYKNRPDLIIKKINENNIPLISHYANQYRKRLRKLGQKDLVTTSKSLPIAKINSKSIEGKFAKIEFQLSSKMSNLKTFNIFVNDVPLFGIYGKPVTGIQYAGIESIELTEGINKIEISCINSEGIESIRALELENYEVQTPKNIYLLAFGVSKYKNSRLNLNFAHKDALDLEQVVQSLKGKGFDNVYTKVLTNEQVTPDAIKSAKDFVKNAKPDDTFVLFIAGHGMHDKDAEATYYYLTSNADINNLKGTAADFETIEDLLQGIPPRNKLFLMDACESGEIDDETYENLSGFQNLKGLGIASRGFKTTSSSSTVNSQPSTKRTYLYQKDRYIYNDLVRRSGAIVFSSSKGGELSYERSDIENGLFTEYIMKALTTAEADKDNNGIVSTDELREYVSAQVAKASGDLQHPTVDRDNIYQKFGFGLR